MEPEQNKIKKFDIDSIWIGFVIGVISPLMALLLFYKIKFGDMTPSEFKHLLDTGGIFSHVISLCVIVNLAIFYLFLNKEKYKATRGILLSTLIYAGYIAYLKLF